MNIAEASALNIVCPESMRPDLSAWAFLKQNCRQIRLQGFCPGPVAVIGAWPLAGDQYLILESPFYMEGLEDLYMGEIVIASRAQSEALCLTEIKRPLRMAHYECDGFDHKSESHRLVMSLYGEWESVFSGQLHFVHIPVAFQSVFESSFVGRLTRQA